MLDKTDIDEIVKLINTILGKYGVIFWHKSKYGSIYFKFRDIRLGSIRISDHKGRDKYTYSYNIFYDKYRYR